VTVPISLRSPELDLLWALARSRLESRGRNYRGRLTLPPLSSSATLVLKSLVGRQVGKTVDLAVLEVSLARLRIGEDLPRALAALGYEISDEPARRRAEHIVRKEARSAARSFVSGWPEPWTGEWITEVIRAGTLRGLDASQARAFLLRVRAVLDCFDRECSTPISRVDLAARVLGSSHALDDGTRIEAAVTRALSFKLGPAVRRHLWAQAGVHLDLTSAPVLTWRLPLTGNCGLARLSAAATDSGIPLHLSRFALEAHPPNVPRGSCILVVENPRVVEAAAQMRASTPVISTNGRPSSTVLLLLAGLLDAGAELRYHGDFDAAGFAICESLMRVGLTPWRMNAADYLTALAAADAEGADLLNDPQPPGLTPWDPVLQRVFERERRIVHEERLLPGLIEE
jgi:uncharacterized protein (TIGR02679 family)